MSRRSTPELQSGSTASVDSASADGLLVASIPDDDDDVLPADDTGTRSALQVLEELFTDGKISGKKMAHLRDTFSQLSDAVVKMQAREANLMNDAKALTQGLSATETGLARVTTFPEGETTESGQQRQLLLKHQNALALVEERQEKLNYDMNMLTAERDGLRKDYERMPKPEEIKAQANSLRQETAMIQEQLALRQKDVSSLTEELARIQEAVSKAKEEREKALYCQVEVKDELVKARGGSSSMLRQCTSLQNEKKEIEAGAASMLKEHRTVTEESSRMAAKLKKLTATLDHLKDVLAQREQHQEQSQKEFGGIAKALEISKEEEVTLSGDKLQSELQLQHLEAKKQHMFDESARLTKEKDAHLKTLKLLQLQASNIEEGLLHLRKKKVAQTEELAVLQSEAGMLEEKEGILKREHQNAGRGHEDEIGLTADEKKRAREMQQMEKTLRQRVARLQAARHIGNHKFVQAARERNEKATLSQQMKNDIVRRQNQILLMEKELVDLEKLSHTTEDGVTQFRQLHDGLKAERSKLAQMITLSYRKTKEYADRLKIRRQEVDILKKDVREMNKLIARSKLRYQSNASSREVIKHEVAKLHTDLLEATTKSDHQRGEVEKMMECLQQVEREMMGLRCRFDDAMSQRNDRGISLVSANEDVSCFHEQFHVHETLLQAAKLELEDREEEIRFLRVELAEENRALEVVRSAIPSKRKLDNDFVVAQIQLAETRDQRSALEEEFTDPRGDRISFLRGKDPDMAELVAKEGELQGLLEDKEKQLHEKTLMLGEVKRMAKDAQKMVDSSSEHTLTEAKRINDLRTKLTQVNRKLMSHVAEMTVQQTNVLKMKQDVEEKEELLDEARKRMDTGLAPMQELEEEWLKQCQQAEARQGEELAASQETPSFRTLENGTMTTAVYRTNAYEFLPSDSLECSFTKPFGAHGSFTPAAKGSGIRHYRKPVQKPIEI